MFSNMLMSNKPTAISAAFLDNFVDVNGTLLPAHTSDSGHTWTTLFGSDIDIQGNEARLAAGTDSIASFDTGLSNVSVEATIGSLLGNISCVVRVFDLNNFFLGLWFGGSIFIFEKSAGTYFNRGSVITSAPVTGDLLKMTDDGVTIMLFVNGVLKVSYATTVNNAVTKQGLRLANSAGSRISKLTVNPL